MSTSWILYLLLNGIAAALCLWAVVTAAARIEEHGGSHRAWTLVAGLLLPPALVVSVLRGLGEVSWLAPATALLPILALAATWSNVVTLAHQSLALRLLALPVLLYDAGLAGVYTVRVLQDLAGLDLSTFGAAVTAGHALVQTRVGCLDAEVNPVYLHLPFLLPLWLAYRPGHTFALLLASLLAAGMTWLMAIAMPAAYVRAHSYREPTTATTTPWTLSGATEVGVFLPIADRLLDDGTRKAWRARLVTLGVRRVSVEAGPELFEDEPLLAQVREEFDYCRQLGARISVVIAPGRALARRPARTLDELSSEFAKTQWLAAERLAPDLLVLFRSPFRGLGPLVMRPPTLDEWMKVIERCAKDARQANAKVKLAVALEPRLLDSAELFRRLKADDSPVDVVGLDLNAGPGTLREAENGIEMVQRWSRRTPGSRPVEIVAAGAGPHVCGGELGQWTYLANVLEMAVSTTSITGVTIDDLVDGRRSQGLLTREGRPRMAYEELRQRMHPPTRPGR
ncbi:MAG: hypothetical protein IT458_09515 [Planctomycetes bacterium]|nr:hypothetical protein [Planctomycetota bacterium]